MDTPSLPPLEQQARWAATALALSEQPRDPRSLTAELQRLLAELDSAGISHICEHPSAQVLIGHLAEAAGLQFHWPAAADYQCRQLVARQRAASSCIELSAAA
jgi:hypothetical protein